MGPDKWQHGPMARQNAANGYALQLQIIRCCSNKSRQLVTHVGCSNVGWRVGASRLAGIELQVQTDYVCPSVMQLEMLMLADEIHSRYESWRQGLARQLRVGLYELKYGTSAKCRAITPDGWASFCSRRAAVESVCLLGSWVPKT